MTIKERKTNITDNVPINPVKDKRLPMVSLSYPNPPTNLKAISVYLALIPQQASPVKLRINNCVER